MASEAHYAIVKSLRENLVLGGGDGPFDVAELRRGMETLTAAAPLVEGAQSEAVDAAGVPAEWVWVEGAAAERTILYLHGGGYVVGSINTHRGLAGRIAKAADARVLLIDYRLGPEDPFPAAVDDATAAYGWLLDQGIAPGSLSIGGDSAGGGLTFATLIALRDAGTKLPASAFALSPWVDLEGLGESMTTKTEEDPMVQKDGLVMMGQLYLGGADPKTPLASPLYADLTGLPPMLVQVGTAETLLDDSTRIAEVARQAGVQLELDPFEEMIHVFQAFAPALPEALDAIEKIGAFVKRNA